MARYTAVHSAHPATMPVHYAIQPADPDAHLYHVTCTVEAPDPAGQLFMLPAWIPGSYMIREFARNIVRIAALSDDVPVELTKLDKHTWRAPPVDGPLTVVCEVYAWDLSVRAAHLDRTHGFFNGTSVFLLPIGHEHERVTVDLLPPDGDEFADWRVATTLTPARGTRRGRFGRYGAADYDELIDCPVELGTFVLARFDVLGVPHEVAITGHAPALDMERLTHDLARVCEAQIRLFEPRSKTAPFARYLFLVMAVDDGYGGLEHRRSTALITRRDALPWRGMKDAPEAYRNFLGLASHEYFHSWNVKRIRPAAFVPYDLTAENHTRLLWLFEGFTSYYDDLMLVRCGLLTEPQYLDTLARTLTSVSQRSSRMKQSVADSSFDAWIKYYRQDENAPNSVVSYYQKGALVALALDCTIRAGTDGKRSLDDLMRLLWSQWKAAGADYAGVDEDALPAALHAATGLDLAEQLAHWTAGTADPDWPVLLAAVGVALETRPALDRTDFALLGITTTANGSELRVQHVFDGGPAQRAGVSAGDVLVALDGLRCAPGRLDALLARYPAGAGLPLIVFRRDELQSLRIELAARPPTRITLKPATERAAQRRAWLSAR